MNKALLIFSYALVAGLSSVVSTGAIPSDPVGWCGLALVVITTALAKFSQPDNAISNARRVYTEDERRKLAGLPPKFLNG